MNRSSNPSLSKPRSPSSKGNKKKKKKPEDALEDTVFEAFSHGLQVLHP
jgi:hypothetical protein